MKYFEHFCDEIWIVISSYFDNLKYLINLKFSFGKKYNYILGENKDQFWFKLINNYLTIRGIDTSLVMKKFKNPDSDSLRSTNYNLIKTLFSNKKCTHSGCFKIYNEWSNNSDSCLFHPGKKNSTGRLSCCREKSFQSIGCKSSFHDGLFYSIVNLERPTLNNDNISNATNSNNNEENKFNFLPMLFCQPNNTNSLLEDKMLRIMKPRIDYISNLPNI